MVNGRSFDSADCLRCRRRDAKDNGAPVAPAESGEINGIFIRIRYING